jgi:hypothetical protein
LMPSSIIKKQKKNWRIINRRVFSCSRTTNPQVTTFLTTTSSNFFYHDISRHLTPLVDAAVTWLIHIPKTADLHPGSQQSILTQNVEVFPSASTKTPAYYLAAHHVVPSDLCFWKADSNWKSQEIRHLWKPNFYYLFRRRRHWTPFCVTLLLKYFI